MVRVLNAGFYTTVQDVGRFGYGQYGVPISGVMDRYSASVANMLLGNEEYEAVLEMTMVGAILQFQNPTYICLSGANMSPKLNNVSIGLNKVFRVSAGDNLSFGKLLSGFRCYLAVLGGFKTPTILGSKSMYQGITHQYVVLKNDLLDVALNNSFLIDKNASVKVNDKSFESGNIEVYKGPEFEYLSQEQQMMLSHGEFTISKNNNRMAYQLSESFQNTLNPIITSSVLPGTVQLTPSGTLIILMRDCQTTGGYPRILQLKESAINVLAQKFTGHAIRFKLV